MRAGGKSAQMGFWIQVGKVATHLAEQTKNLVSVSFFAQAVTAVQIEAYEVKKGEEVEDSLVWCLRNFVTGTTLPPFEQSLWQSWDRKQTLFNPNTVIWKWEWTYPKGRDGPLLRRLSVVGRPISIIALLLLPLVESRGAWWAYVTTVLRPRSSLSWAIDMAFWAS